MTQDHRPSTIDHRPLNIGIAPRRAALRILERVGKGLPLDAALELGMKGLEGADRRLAHELAAGVLRQISQLDARLAPHVPRGLASIPPQLRGVLRLGVYQMDRLDRVPPHAAVSTSVDLAREVAGAKAAGFVNAVLRKAADRTGGASEAVGDGVVTSALTALTATTVLTASALSSKFSHPEWLVERWLTRFGAEETEALLAWNNRRPELVLQPAREDQATLSQRLQAAGTAVRLAPFDGGLVVESRSPTGLAGYAEGAFMVQDPAQALVVRYADFPSDAIVYDACAAPGGKTIALGRRVQAVIAGEARRSRLARLTENVARAGGNNTFVLLGDASRPPIRECRAVLLDAPCLGTGTFTRHPDARWKVSLDSLSRLTRRQAELIDATARLVPVGGLLVYATCSLEPEENVEQVERFLARVPGFVRERPAEFPSELLNPAGDLTLLPQRHAVDGAFAARLRRVA